MGGEQELATKHLAKQEGHQESVVSLSDAPGEAETWELTNGLVTWVSLMWELDHKEGSMMKN